jgi:hypothetical protein
MLLSAHKQDGCVTKRARIAAAGLDRDEQFHSLERRTWATVPFSVRDRIVRKREIAQDLADVRNLRNPGATARQR